MKSKYCVQCGRKHNRDGNLCRKHEWQLMKFGEFKDSNPRNKFDKNAYTIEGDTIKVELYSYPTWDIAGYFTASLEDLELIRSYKWSLNSTGYVRTSINGSFIALHHLIMGKRPGATVDHIDKNPLNNTRGNLRIISQGDNNANRDPYNKLGVKGVEQHKSGKYSAYFFVARKKYYSGVFNTIEEASFARYILEQMFSPVPITPCNTDLHNSLSIEKKEEIISRLKNHYNK